MTRTSPKKPRDPPNLPNWQRHVHLFDGLEISPCVSDGSSISVTDDPDEADFWSVYSTATPCPMCQGALYWARIRRYHNDSTPESGLAPKLSC